MAASTGGSPRLVLKGYAAMGTFFSNSFMMGIQNGTATLEDNWQFHTKLFTIVLCYAKSCLTLCTPTEPDRLLSPWDPPGKSTGVGCHFLLHGIFLTQVSNSHLLSPA